MSRHVRGGRPVHALSRSHSATDSQRERRVRVRPHAAPASRRAPGSFSLSPRADFRPASASAPVRPAMSASVAPDAVFLSALPPSGSSMSTYAVPTDAQLEHGNAPLDEAARARRVQQQVQMRLAEKSSAPLSSVARANGSVSNYASSDF
ncbi:hypothetical protein Z043_114827 [Scleropages formosus]|uniref:Uncharacterized protein n=1 Tax=Scleropages formosus TaxID=113540 RepID=A0A0P7TYQ1_SCLFO|nr:hypothetical protein Z043_114827 [Scleropages formosus]